LFFRKRNVLEQTWKYVFPFLVFFVNMPARKRILYVKKFSYNFFRQQKNCSVTSVKNDNTPAVSIFHKTLVGSGGSRDTFQRNISRGLRFLSFSFFTLKRLFSFFFIGFLNLFINFSVWELVILSLPHPNFMFSSSYLQQKLCHQISATEKSDSERLFDMFFHRRLVFSKKMGRVFNCRRLNIGGLHAVENV